MEGLQILREYLRYQVRVPMEMLGLLVLLIQLQRELVLEARDGDDVQGHQPALRPLTHVRRYTAKTNTPIAPTTRPPMLAGWKRLAVLSSKTSLS